MHQELAKSKQPRLEDLAAVSSPQAADGVHCVGTRSFFFRSIRSSWSALFCACSCKRMYLVMLLSFNETKCSHGIWSSKSEKRSQFHGARYTWIWCDRDVWPECRESMKMMTLMLGCGRPFVSKVAPYRWHSVFQHTIIYASYQHSANATCASILQDCLSQEPTDFLRKKEFLGSGWNSPKHLTLPKQSITNKISEGQTKTLAQT